MILLAQAALLLWIPVVLAIFASRPPRRAVVTSYIFAWLFLPKLSFPIRGLPDYDKMSATSVGILLSVLIFDSGRIRSLRPRWFDVPMALYCGVPLASSVSIGLGPYEGLSASLFHVFAWGMPYLIGRLYLTDFDAVRELALGMVAGGLAYVPLCLFEIRLSPVLEKLVYGIGNWEPTRYGGYRPHVFLASGLELGMWMANASLVSYWLWASGSVRTVRGYGMGKLTLALVATTILCKSTGAALLMLVGIASLWLAGKLGRSWPVWILLAVPPLYEVSRTSGLWSAREVVGISDRLFGGDRAQSLEYRLDNEELLFVRVRMHPYLGWGRFGGFQTFNKFGRPDQVFDGFWLVTLGYFGFAGLATMNTCWLMPLALLIRRVAAPAWRRPEAGAAAVLAVVLALHMTDHLSNGMLNPVYGLVMGGLATLALHREGESGPAEDTPLARARAFRERGMWAEAELECRRAIAVQSRWGGPPLVEAWEGLGDSEAGQGRPEDAERAFGQALAILGSLPAGTGRSTGEALLREKRARALAESGRPAESVALRRQALAIWDELATARGAGPEVQGCRLDALNDLAWLLATDPDAATRDPDEALRLAEEAARAGSSACRNTLGVARYRAGDWAGAVEALGQSVAGGPPGGTAFDHYFLAMSWHRLGDDEQALAWLRRADAWSLRHRPGHPTLDRFREEAAALIDGASRPA